jgi:hypothetical protein
MLERETFFGEPFWKTCEKQRQAKKGVGLWEELM